MKQGQRTVIAAVIERNGAFLLCRRPLDKRHGGLWEFPGGKVEEGETLLQAAQRELEEELALRATAAGIVRFSILDQASGHLIQFVDVQTEGEPELVEHMDLAWTKAADLLSLDLAPSDRSFAQFILNQ